MSAPALAFDERARTIAWTARTIHRLYNANAQRILDREGLAIAHWYHLRVLGRHGTLNQLELSRRVGMASTTTVSALDHLEQRGLLRRTRDASDRRKYFVSLTDEGRRLLQGLLPGIEQMLEASLQGVGRSDLQVFWAVLHRISHNLATAAGDEAVLD